MPRFEHAAKFWSAELDLSLGCLTDEGANALVTHKAAFGHLDKLDISSNYVTHDGVAMLKKCFGKKLVSRTQRDDPDDGIEYRSPAVCE